MIAVSKRSMSFLPQKKQSKLTFNRLNKKQSHWRRFSALRRKMTHVTSNLKKRIENGSPDKEDLEDVNYLTLRHYYM